jgi:hypothetical protein
MRLRMPNPPRLWRPMYSVMRLIDVDPHIARRIIRSRRLIGGITVGAMACWDLSRREFS